MIDTKVIFFHHDDVADVNNLTRLLEKIHPEGIYNLVGQSHVRVYFEIPDCTA